MPEPLEAVDTEQATVLWRVQTPTAGLLLARKVTTTARGQAADLGQQLRQLRQLTLYNVESVVGASEQGDAVWVMLAPVPNCTVGRLLTSGEVTVPQRAILALDLLAGLAELHGAGLGHARLSERTVIVDVEGRLRLAEPWRLPGEVTDQASEVRRAGELTCWILGVAGRPGGALTPAEQQAPALVAVARSLAAGGQSKASDAFQALREAAGRLVHRESLEPSRAELSRLVRSHTGMAPPAPRAPAAAAPAAAAPLQPPEPQVPVAPAPMYAPVPPASAAPMPLDDLDEEPEPAPQRPPPPLGFRSPYADQRRTRPRVPIVAVAVAAIAALIVLLLLVVPALLRLTQGTTSGSPTAQSQGPPASPQATATAPTPTPQQTATGAVTGILLTQQGSCTPGSTCSIEADVHFQPTQQQTAVTWTYKVTDVCHGNTTTSHPGSSVNAEPGWVHVISDSVVPLPASGRVQIVAVTSSPADATSDTLTFGSGC